jgi:high-affinity Fe2+/Pb2+ permease
MRMEWVQFLTYMPFISVAIVAGLVIMALVNFSTLRKSMQMQSEQQIYSRIMDARLKLEITETSSVSATIVNRGTVTFRR